MTLSAIYRMTGDGLALDYLRELIATSYDYYQDEDTSNGLRYAVPRPEGRENKSIYADGLVLAALEYQEFTKGPSKEDSTLYVDIMNRYQWMEEHFRRDGEKTLSSKTYSRNDKMY